MIVLDLGRLEAFHLVHALDAWRRTCRNAEPRVPFPAALDELRRRAWSSVSERQEATPLPSLVGVTETQPVPRLWYSVADTARALDVSERQVERWVADGSLASFRVGGLRRLHAADVAAFSERRGVLA